MSGGHLHFRSPTKAPSWRPGISYIYYSRVAGIPNSLLCYVWMGKFSPEWKAFHGDFCSLLKFEIKADFVFLLFSFCSEPVVRNSINGFQQKFGSCAEFYPHYCIMELDYFCASKQSTHHRARGNLLNTVETWNKKYTPYWKELDAEVCYRQMLHCVVQEDAGRQWTDSSVLWWFLGHR